MNKRFGIAVAMFLSLCCSQLFAQTLNISGVLELETGFDGLGVEGQDFELNLDFTGQIATPLGADVLTLESSSFSLTIGGTTATSPNGVGFFLNFPNAGQATLIEFPISSAPLDFTLGSNDFMLFGSNIIFSGVDIPADGGPLAADAFDDATLGFGVIDTIIGFIDPSSGVLSNYMFASPVLKGDVNLSGNVDFSDIAPFIALLSAGETQPEADVDCNGEVNFLDIAPFIAILSGS